MGTRSSQSDRARSEISKAHEDALRDASLRMARTLPHGVPLAARSTLYAVSCAERRRPHVLGSYPLIAFACAKDGAPIHDVLAPVRELEAILRSRFYLQRLPTLDEAQQLETDAEWQLNKLQLVLDARSPRCVIAKARDAAVVHRSAIETLLSVLDSSYYSPNCRLSA